MIDIDRKIYIRKLAAKLLLAQSNLSNIIDVRDMSLPQNIYIASFEEYANITSVNINNLICNGALSDGYTIKTSDSNIILYNSMYDTACPQRLRFSLAHELGHIFLNHSDDNHYSEEEANYFASQIVAHDAIVINMLSGNWNADMDFIREEFGISWDTADIKLRQINRNKNAYSAVESNLFLKYKNCFRSHKYIKNKFATPFSLDIEYDCAYA